MIKGGVLFVLLILSMSSCSGLSNSLPTSCCEGVRDTQSEDYSRVIAGEIRLSRGEVRQVLRVQLEEDTRATTLVGITPLGTRWFSVVQVAGQYRVEHAKYPPLLIPPSELLCGLKLLLGSRESLDKCCEEDWNFEAVGEGFEFYRNKEKSLRIEPGELDDTRLDGASGLVLYNFPKDYRLEALLIDLSAR